MNCDSCNRLRPPAAQTGQAPDALWRAAGQRARLAFAPITAGTHQGPGPISPTSTAYLATAGHVFDVVAALPAATTSSTPATPIPSLPCRPTAASMTLASPLRIATPRDRVSSLKRRPRSYRVQPSFCLARAGRRLRRSEAWKPGSLEACKPASLEAWKPGSHGILR
ncbi:hypothetical protein [Burkholderia glumae]|uniref:hypothetical protein n=1 Tax=Burkholderia glumae TaxID=337 RepID=UPI00215008DC|nr:hypothetical protein [Burkholderia glumae]